MTAPLTRLVVPMPPLKALEFFRSLIPIAGVKDPGRWADDLHRVAFTLAKATEETLLKKVQAVITEALSKGHVGQAQKDIQELLDGLGVSPKNSSYGEMVLRTNMMDAYNTGATQEIQDMQDDFPAWQYLGIRDGRQGADHEPHFDKYFPSSVAFAAVRGNRPWNCRCTQRPVYKGEWRRLQARGVNFSSFAERPETEEFCGGPGSGVPGPCPEGGESGGAHVAQIHERAQGKAARLVRQSRQLARRFGRFALDKAKAKVTSHFDKLSNRYGKKMAVAILAAGIAGTAVPLPGTTFLAAAPLLAAGEAYRYWTRPAHAAAHAEQDGKPELTQREIEQLGRQFMKDIAMSEGGRHDHAEGDNTNLVPVPCREQELPYSCGAAALRSVLAYLGHGWVTEADLRELLGSDPDAGTPPVKIIDVAGGLGLKVQAHEHWTVPQLERALLLGRPVMIPLQAYGGDADERADEAGHWVVCTGYDRNVFYFEDPAYGRRAYVPRKEFLRRWHDRDGCGLPYRRYGIMFVR